MSGNDQHESPVSRLRRVRAVAIVVALVLAVPAADAALRAVVPAEDGARASPATGLDANALAGVGGPEAFLDRLEALATVDVTGSGGTGQGSAGPSDVEAPEVPAAFASEIGFLDGARDVRVSDGGAVVGYVMEGDAREVLEQLNRHMEAAGWAGVALGDRWGATYVKNEGACTWALASCTQVGAATSVVVRWVAS